VQAIDRLPRAIPRFVEARPSSRWRSASIAETAGNLGGTFFDDAPDA
jgi:hypothetical protein